MDEITQASASVYYNIQPLLGDRNMTENRYILYKYCYLICGRLYSTNKQFK